MQLFSSSLFALAFAVLWPVALLVIAVFCAWLERRTLLPPETAVAGRSRRRLLTFLRTRRRPAATAAVLPRPAAQAPARPATPPASEQRPPRPAVVAPIPPLPPVAPEADTRGEPGEALGRYRPLSSAPVPPPAAHEPVRQQRAAAPGPAAQRQRPPTRHP